MSNKRAVDYVKDLLRELDDIAAFTEDGQQVFFADVKTQKAVIRSYEIIGEIAKRLPRSLRDEIPEIDWRQLINFRDFLAHNYDRVAVRLLWAAVEDVPRLRSAVGAMLADLEANENEA